MISSRSWKSILVQRGVFRIHAFSLIFLLAIFVPFQELVFTLLSPLGSIVSLGRVSVEAAVFLIFVALVVRKRRLGETLLTTPLDKPLLVFLGVALLSLIVNNVFTLGALDNMRVLLRYVLLYYIVVNLRVSDREILDIQKIIVISGIFSGALSVILKLVPALNRLLLPRGAALGGIVKKAAGIKVGAVVGPFSVPAETGIFLLLALIAFYVYVRTRPTPLNRLGVQVVAPGLILFGIFVTYKRAALFLAPVALALIVLYDQGIRRLTRLILISLGIIVIIAGLLLVVSQIQVISEAISPYAEALNVRQQAFDITHFLLQLFTPGYWQRNFNVSRGWMIVNVGGHMLTSGNIFGYGPDNALTRLEIAARAPELFRVTRYAGYEDVYWVAMLSYFGIVGLGVFVFLFYRLYRVSRKLQIFSETPGQRRLGLLFSVYSVIFFLYSFVERAPELKVPSFFFWLLAGLVVNRYLSLKMSKGMAQSKQNHTKLNGGISE